MAEKSLPGMEFADWTSLPSITETMARQQAGGAKSPLMMIAGKLLEQFNSSGQPPDGSVPAPDMGMAQGLSYPSKTGIDPNANSVSTILIARKLPSESPRNSSVLTANIRLSCSSCALDTR
jgi:hypothetical protein